MSSKPFFAIHSRCYNPGVQIGGVGDHWEESMKSGIFAWYHCCTDLALWAERSIVDRSRSILRSRFGPKEGEYPRRSSLGRLLCWFFSPFLTKINGDFSPAVTAVQTITDWEWTFFPMFRLLELAAETSGAIIQSFWRLMAEFTVKHSEEFLIAE